MKYNIPHHTRVRSLMQQTTNDQDYCTYWYWYDNDHLKRKATNDRFPQFLLYRYKQKYL